MRLNLKSRTGGYSFQKCECYLESDFYEDQGFKGDYKFIVGCCYR